MGEKMKLKVKALRILQADLHRDEMVAIYLMQFGTDLPPNLAKHLTKIVRLLCKKLDWIDDKCDPPGPASNSIFLLFYGKNDLFKGDDIFFDCPFSFLSATS